MLTSKYKEERIAGGLSKSQTFVTEVWASPGGATYTVIVRDTRGQACILAGGVEWTQHKMKPAGLEH